MATENCEHKYFSIVDGKLECSVCGAGPEAQKAAKQSENKAKPKSSNKGKSNKGGK